MCNRHRRSRGFTIFIWLYDLEKWHKVTINWVMSLTPSVCHRSRDQWWSVDAKSLSREVAEILSFRHFGVMTLTLSGHVTSSVKWPFEPQMVISYWSSIDTMSLSPTVAEILSIIVSNRIESFSFLPNRPSLAATTAVDNLHDGWQMAVCCR